MKKQLAVVDVETTGLGKSDRIVEVAVVLIDAHSFEVVDEYETLINPLRDIGPTHIHGVTAQMVEAAPTFDDVSGYLGRLIDGQPSFRFSLSPPGIRPLIPRFRPWQRNRHSPVDGRETFHRMRAFWHTAPTSALGAKRRPCDSRTFAAHTT